MANRQFDSTFQQLKTLNTTDLHIPSNKVRDIERYCLDALNGLYPHEEIRSFINILFEAYLGWDTAHLLLHRDSTINQSDLLKFHWAVEDLKRYRPIQHIIGYTDFCDCRIGVGPEVLIPRPETEQLINLLLQKQHPYPCRILDLCTGSGCIAIALAKHIPEAQVQAIDISEEALSHAKENAIANSVTIDFRQVDLLHWNATEWQDYDLIVSNPPYVLQSEQLDHNVMDYEPHQALFVPENDPLLFYRAIAELAQQHLHGLLALEINETLGAETCNLMKSYGFKPTLLKDFRDKDRFIIAMKH